MRARGLRAPLGMLALALACSDAPPPPGTEPGDPPGPAQTSDELFSLDQLPRFDLRIDADSWAALEAEPLEWVPGSFEYAGVEYANVGIRLKGNHSFRPLGEKASFKIKFNEYVSGRRFLGLEALTLNNMVTDSSMLREWIGYRVFRELEVPAPRAGFAQVWVNGEEYGLYLDLEPYDDEFLDRVYADPSGNLYESDQNADLDTSIDAWHQDEGKDKSRADLMAFAALAQQDGDAVFYGAQAMVDLPEFLAFMAGETIVGHFDGHIGGHNFFIYHEPTLDLWSYQPWGLDQALARHVTPYEHEGYLGAKCLHDPGCLVDYVEAARLALDRLRDIDMQAEVDRAIALTDAAMRSDPKKPYSTASVESGRVRSLDYILARADELAPQLDCLVDGVEPDADDDGYGPCFQDCDESDPAINPDAEEVCDGVDDDCTGYVDDVPACPCPSIVSEGRTFYLCHNHLRWLDARDYCVDQGHVLARFTSATQTSEVWAAAQAIEGGRWAIGLDDRDQEGEFVWQDGSAPSFTSWAAGEPSHQLDWFDCVFLRDGAWLESNCIEKGSFVCTDD
ncbi:CotH kinase family protein [Nannocystaceae bacterium ST9]